jgi:HK97 gp10 family phage protein
MKGKWSDIDSEKVLTEAARLALAKIGLVMQSDAKLLCPYNTGRLRGSITWQIESQGSHVQRPAQSGDECSKPDDNLTLNVGTAVEYAQHMEYGTVRAQAQPYLRPAFDHNKDIAQKLFAQEIKKAIEKEAHGKH